MARSTTPNLGAGFAPAGTTPFGFGSPATAIPLVGVPFDMADTGTGFVGTGRRINPDTRDFEFDPETGRALGMTASEQRVYLALITQKGSAADPKLGTSISSIQTGTGNLSQRVTDEVNAALSTLVSEGSIRIVSIEAYQKGTVLQTKVVWTDTSDGSQRTTTV